MSQLLDSGETIALPWITIWAFVRIGANSRIHTNPLSPKAALAIVEEWLEQPGVVPLNPGPLHTGISKLCHEPRSHGPDGDRLRQAAAFLSGRTPPDFAADNFEVDFRGRATEADLTPLGRSQMGLPPL